MFYGVYSFGFMWAGFETPLMIPYFGLFPLWITDLETYLAFFLCFLLLLHFQPYSPTPTLLLLPTFLPFFPSIVFLSLRAKDMKNRLAFLRRRNESPGSNPAGKLDKSMKSVK